MNKEDYSNMSNTNIFLYWPNIIGYFRILISVLGLCYSDQYWLLASSHAISQILDAVDGEVARALNQTSLFGMYLDMIIDRMSTVGIVAIAISRMPQYTLFLISILIFDLAGHWLNCVGSLKCGVYHKDVKENCKGLIGLEL